MRITVPVGCGDAVVEAVACFFNSPKLGQSLGGHLVGGNVVVVVLDEGVELSECGIGAAFRLMSHRQSVAGKCVGGVLLKHLGEECDAIHMSMVRRDAWSWQAAAITLVGMSEEVLARTVCQSQSERSEIIFPSDANALGNLFGGRLMQYIDLVGAMAASRHARAITVTASMDHLDFVAPVHVGVGPRLAGPIARLGDDGLGRRHQHDEPPVAPVGDHLQRRRRQRPHRAIFSR